VSSVFLFVAIVAIWAFVLVPRRLRRHHAQTHGPAEDDVETYAPPDGYGEADDDMVESADYPDDEDEQVVAAAPPDNVATTAASSPSRARMLQARRRLLTILVLVVAAAAAATAVRLIPWWTASVPTVALVCYFLLLRTAARADAEHARRMAAMYEREARIQADRRRATLASAPGAQIIDISSRAGDQLYDQYADAAVRAVGD
jgi:hypothetical protein